jgi:hypothetical protein
MIKNFETLGVFGLSNYEKLAKNIGFPVTMLNGSTYGAIVKQMHDIFYQLIKKGYGRYQDTTKAELARLTNQSIDTVNKFIIQLDKLETTGQTVPANADNPANVPKTGLDRLILVAGLIAGALIIGQVSQYIPKPKRA